MKKIKSNAGASLSISLLLFLVCVVVGSVVLTAGATAADRMSDLVESDQRYYSVTSAASFLAEKLCAPTVKITRVKTITTFLRDEFFPIFNDDGEQVGTYLVKVKDRTETSWKTTIDGGGTIKSTNSQNANLPPADSFLTKEAMALLFGDNKCNTDEAMEYTFTHGDGSTRSFTMTFSGDTKGDLTVSGTYAKDTEGRLIFKIHNGGEDETEKYAVTLTLVPEISTKKTIVPDTLPLNEYEDPYETTIESTIKWKLDSIIEG